MRADSVPIFHRVEPDRADYPIIANLLLRKFPVTSILDLGCNAGYYLREFIKRGCDRVFGVDGRGMEDSIVINRSLISRSAQ